MVLINQKVDPVGINQGNTLEDACNTADNLNQGYLTVLMIYYFHKIKENLPTDANRNRLLGDLENLTNQSRNYMKEARKLQGSEFYDWVNKYVAEAFGDLMIMTYGGETPGYIHLNKNELFFKQYDALRPVLEPDFRSKIAGYVANRDIEGFARLALGVYRFAREVAFTVCKNDRTGALDNDGSLEIYNRLNTNPKLRL